MEALIEQLIELKFTRTEASVYIMLVKYGRLSGYKVAKLLGIARSTVYSALDSLYERGCIYLIPGEAKEYEPKNPELMIEDLKREFLSTADKLKEALIHIEEDNTDKHFINIKGIDNIISKTKELLLLAQKEVYISTDFELTEFEAEFNKLTDRGVRIIVFTFSNQECSRFPVEVYSEYPKGFHGRTTRLMLVVDFEKTLLAGYEEGNSYIGTFTDNKLLAHIASEHIHHDIYLLRLKNKYKKDLVEKDIFIQTLAERQGGFNK